MSDDNEAPKWLESLPEQLRDAPFIGKAENMEDAVGKLAHAAQYMGQAVKMPPADATPEVIEAFFDKVKGVPGMARLPLPDDADGYKALMAKLGTPAEHTDYAIPDIDDFDWDEGMAESLRKYALEAGLTKNQFDTFARKIAEQEQGVSADTESAVADARKALRLDWGETLEEREGLIRGYLDKSEAPQAMRDMLDSGQFPLESMNWLYSIAKQFKGEVAPINKDGASPTPAMDTSTARAKIQELMQHEAYWNAADPRNKDMIAEMVKLQKLANPEQAA